MKAVVYLDDLSIRSGMRELATGETIRFGWQGVEYEIDLSAANAAGFANGMQPYIDAARRVGVVHEPPGEAVAPQPQKRKELPPASPDVPKRSGVYLNHALGKTLWIYNREMRDWFDGLGHPVEGRESPSGTVYYVHTAAHYRAYETYLDTLDRLAAPAA